MKKKYLLTIIIICSAVFLASWGKKDVKLLNDTKLIDLDAAIEKCISGANSAKEPETSDSASDYSSVEKEPNDETLSEDIEKVIVITVRNQTITYNKEKYTDLNKLKAKIVQDNGEYVSFRLVDDFAEAHVYKEVLSILSDLEEEIGLNYTRE